MKLTEQEKLKKATAKRYKQLASIDEHGNKLVDTCSRCGAANVQSHKHHTYMCVDCGKLYDRWRKALRNCTQSELRLLKPVLLEKYERLLQTDKATASRCAGFYKKVAQTEITETNEQTEVNTMDQIEKRCKQCGRTLDISRFRQYVSRSKGIYNTSTGHNTICKDCESINNRAAAALKKNDEETLVVLRQHYQTLSDRGLPPVTAAARRVLGVDEAQDKSAKKGLVDLLAAVQCTSAEEAESELDKHCRLVRERGYANADEAYETHRSLLALFKDDKDLVAEMNELIEEWYDDEG